MTNSIATFASGLIQRLAATIPSTTTTKQQLFSHYLSEFSSNPQTLRDLTTLTIIVVLALELLNKLVYHTPTLLHNALHNNNSTKKKKSIPVRGKHLDNFSIKDYTFIMINKCMTGLFVYCYFGYLWSVRELPTNNNDINTTTTLTTSSSSLFNTTRGNGIFTHTALSLTNTLLPLPLLFLTYDFFYTLLHWFLHIKSVYVYIHKHHHYQKAPSRANLDAVNVHPLEFFLGEFNHIMALYLVIESGLVDVSYLGAVLFIGVGGVLAGLNHTRHDVVVSVPSSSSNVTLGTVESNSSDDDASNSTKASSTINKNNNNNNNNKGYWTIFDSKHHDVHHRIPQSNYGQYTVFWDRVFGTFRDYDENDRVNPAYQLDPLTGKTVVVKKVD